MFFRFSDIFQLSCSKLKAMWWCESDHTGTERHSLSFIRREADHSIRPQHNRLWPQRNLEGTSSLLRISSSVPGFLLSSDHTQYRKARWREELTVRKVEITCHYTAWMRSCLTGTIDSLKRQQVATLTPQQPLDRPINLHGTKAQRGRNDILSMKCGF